MSQQKGDILSIGKRIKSARIDKGYTQVDLAKQLDLCPLFISELERDIRKPSVSTVIKLSEVLEVTTDYILKSTTN